MISMAYWSQIHMQWPELSLGETQHLGSAGGGKSNYTDIILYTGSASRYPAAEGGSMHKITWDWLERRGPSDPSVHCPALIRGDTSEIQQARRYMNEAPSKFISHSNYMSLGLPHFPY